MTTYHFAIGGGVELGGVELRSAFDITFRHVRNSLAFATSLSCAFERSESFCP